MIISVNILIKILKNIDPRTRNILFRTCFLPDISGTHAVVLSGDEEADETLLQLYHSNFFTYRTSETEAVYRYHPQFKSFLQSQSKHELSAQTIYKTQKTTADLLEKNGNFVTAATLLIEMQCWKKLAEFVVKYASKLMESDRTNVILNWLSVLPDNVISSNPWLVFWRGYCYLYQQPTLARKDCVDAFNTFKNNADIIGQCLSLSGIIDSYTTEHDNMAPLDEWITEATILDKKIDMQTPKQVREMITLSMFSALLHRAPDHSEYDTWLDRVKNIPTDELPHALQINKQLLLTLHYLWYGDFRHVAVYHSLFAQKSSQRAEIAPRILWHIIHASYLWCATGDSHQALKVAKKGLELSKEYDISLWNISLLSHAAAAALMLHDDDEAGNLLNSAADYANNSRRSHLSLYHMLETIHSYRKNDIDSAMFHIQEARNNAEASGVPFYLTSTMCLEAQLWFADKDYTRAKQLSEQSYALAKKLRSNLHQLHHKLFLAILDKAYGNLSAALSHLKQALNFANQYNLIPGLWICDDALADILADAINNDIEPEYACKILAKRRIAPLEISYTIESWPWPIRIYTLDRFETFIAGHKCKTSSRSRPKVFSLLQTLIMFGGKQVREELISETVWPDAEGDAAHQLFDTTLFRLRKFLGSHEALINKEGRLSLNEKICWLDIWALDIGINKITKLLNNTPIHSEKIHNQYLQLKSYYQGDSLRSTLNISLNSISHSQQQLRSKWIRTLYRLADYWLDINCIDYSKSCFETIININPLEEKAYRRLIELYMLLDQRPDALATYYKCKELLKNELNLKPSPETQKVADRIFTTKVK